MLEYQSGFMRWITWVHDRLLPANSPPRSRPRPQLSSAFHAAFNIWGLAWWTRRLHLLPRQHRNRNILQTLKKNRQCSSPTERKKKATNKLPPCFLSAFSSVFHRQHLPTPQLSSSSPLFSVPPASDLLCFNTVLRSQSPDETVICHINSFPSAVQSHTTQFPSTTYLSCFFYSAFLPPS